MSSRRPATAKAGSAVSSNRPATRKTARPALTKTVSLGSPRPPMRKMVDSTRRPLTAKTTTRRRHSSPEDSERDSSWTEAYLRAQMEETESSKELDLSNSALEEIPPAVFRIQELEDLNVSDNSLGSISAKIASLSNLKELRAAGCDVTEISEDVSRCTYLRTVDFSRNPQISALPATMKQLRHLRHVALRDCQLESLPDNLTILDTVETLDLSHNMLTDLPSDIAGLTQVKVLILNDNSFRIIPKPIMMLGSLTCLEMKRNKLNNKRKDLELNVPLMLKVLDVEDNCSLHFLPKGINQLEQIEELNLSYCGIDEVSDEIGHLTTLKRIHLAGNKLRTLPESFGRLINLETLNLEGNGRLYSLPLSLHYLHKLKDKKTGSNMGLVLDNAPVLQFPERRVVREGVVAIRTELLVEDSISVVTTNMEAEIIDDTIIESLSEDIVTIVGERLSDDLIKAITEVAIAVQGCQEDSLDSKFEDVISYFLGKIGTQVEDKDMEEKALALIDQAKRTNEQTNDQVLEEVIRTIVMEDLLEETETLLGREVATSTLRDAAASVVMEELLGEITMTTAKAIASEEEEEWRLGQTVPEVYDKQFSHEVSAAATTVQTVDLPAGCNLSIPPGATDEDTSVITAVINPHGYEGKVKIEDNELLVSDIIEIGPAGMTFAKPVTLQIPHSLPKFDLEREYVVMTSSDDGKTWSKMKTLEQSEMRRRCVTVEVTELSALFAVIARPLEHSHSVSKDEASTLRSSEQTGVEVSLPENCLPDDKEISVIVIPVDKETLSCAELGGIDSMSHIVRFVKGSNLLLNSPATIVLPLAPGKNDKVRILSRNENGDWEDVTSDVEYVVLEGSKVAFKTDRLTDSTALRCENPVDASVIVSSVTKHVRAKRVRTVIFKKWKEPRGREEGIMTARMESVREDFVEDRICRRTLTEGYELQAGTPTPAVSMVENQTVCAIFIGNIHPDVQMVNGLYGIDFKFYCERTEPLDFDMKLVDRRRDASSTVNFFPEPRRVIYPCGPEDKPETPLVVAELTTPRGIICDYWLACQRFKDTLDIKDIYFSAGLDMCFCETCHRDRGDKDCYSRGTPPKEYAPPVGWSRFGLSIHQSFRDLDVFSNWHRAYHGTDPDVVKRILQNSSMLLMPGDIALGGWRLGEREGHFNPDWKPDGFDTAQVFVSPSIKYAGLDTYANPIRYSDGNDGKTYKARVALQLCIRPGSYTVGPETVDATETGRTIDPLFSNEELEWSTRERGGHAIYGLLVKLETP